MCSSGGVGSGAQDHYDSEVELVSMYSGSCWC